MTDYVRIMRSYIGHRPLLICGASVILSDAEGRVLLQRRSDNGCWCFPGGALEPGEKVEEAAARETYEETGLKVGELLIFGVFSGPALHYVYPNQDEVHIVDVVYTSTDYTGEVRCDENETVEIGFFAPTELPGPISPPAVPVVTELLRRSSERPV